MKLNTCGVILIFLSTLGVSIATETNSPQKGETTESPKEGEKSFSDQGYSESQHLSVFTHSEPDLDTAGSGYHDDYHDGYGRGYHSDHGHKGHDGYNDLTSYHGSRNGDYGTRNKLDYYDKGGKAYHGHKGDTLYHDDFHHDDIGHKGHRAGSKGHLINGKRNKGFKNVYHKEEYGVNRDYYDDDDLKKYHSDVRGFDAHFGENRGGHVAGGGYGGKGLRSAYGDRGFHDNGDYYDSYRGRKGGYGHLDHDGYGSLYGNKGGHGRGYGFGDGGFSHAGYGLGRFGHGYGRRGLGRYGRGGYGSGLYSDGLGRGDLFRDDLDYKGVDFLSNRFLDRYNDLGYGRRGRFGGGYGNRYGSGYGW